MIPLKNFNSSDDVLQKAISGKVLARHFKVKEIEIHRSVRGTFVRGDVLIEPASGELIKKIYFGFRFLFWLEPELRKLLGYIK